jgi:DNA-binding CsgD family transcriptional regulator
MLPDTNGPSQRQPHAKDGGGFGEDCVALHAAFDTYLHHEALADARRVGHELRRLGVERRIVSQPRAKTGWDSLTDAELKVVNLIAQGATNRSVAQQLHVTPHTVKAHLHNAFAKLGINSREQLTQLMRGFD